MARHPVYGGEGGRRKNGVFRAITQLTRERCSLCPVNCIDSDTRGPRKPIVSRIHKGAGPATSSRIAIIAGERRYPLLQSDTWKSKRKRYLSLSLARARSYGLVSGRGKGNDTRGEFEMRSGGARVNRVLASS